MSLGEYFALLRKRAGLSQQALSEKAGVSRAYISMIENDHTNVTLGTMSKIAAVLGYDIGFSIKSKDDTIIPIL